jgi:hypothetical protein
VVPAAPVHGDAEPVLLEGVAAAGAQAGDEPPTGPQPSRHPPEQVAVLLPGEVDDRVEGRHQVERRGREGGGGHVADHEPDGRQLAPGDLDAAARDVEPRHPEAGGRQGGGDVPAGAAAQIERVARLEQPHPGRPHQVALPAGGVAPRPVGVSAVHDVVAGGNQFLRGGHDEPPAVGGSGPVPGRFRHPRPGHPRRVHDDLATVGSRCPIRASG